MLLYGTSNDHFEHSIQSVWGMVNTMSLMSHSALITTHATPGLVYEAQKMIVRFYTFQLKSGSDEDESLLGKFSWKPPFNRNFEEMGFFTTNFLPLQYSLIIILSSIIVVALFLKALTRCTVRHWKKACCRKVGTHLPKED
mmetsp:Transcript_14973/g.23171  ORF Transcript_14973/g.23171 Transcript_14973/m.23171 type:complete len:141 (+) Transcript_14973:6233-6655(+)